MDVEDRSPTSMQYVVERKISSVTAIRRGPMEQDLSEVIDYVIVPNPKAKHLVGTSWAQVQQTILRINSRWTWLLIVTVPLQRAVWT